MTFQGNLDFDRENVPKNQLIRIYFKFPFIKTIDQELFPSVGENLGQHYGRFIHSYLQGTLPKWISDHGPFVLIGVEFPRKHLYADEMLSPNSYLYAYSIKSESIPVHNVTGISHLFDMLHFFWTKYNPT
jgi:hypothetical protein